MSTPEPLRLRPLGLRVFGIAGIGFGLGIVVFVALSPPRPPGESARFVDYFAGFMVALIQMHVTWRAALHPAVTVVGRTVVVLNPMRTFVVPVGEITDVHPRPGMTIETARQSIGCWAFSPSIIGRRLVIRRTRELKARVDELRIEPSAGEGADLGERWDLGLVVFALAAAGLAALSLALSQ